MIKIKQYNMTGFIENLMKIPFKVFNKALPMKSTTIITVCMTISTQNETVIHDPAKCEHFLKLPIEDWRLSLHDKWNREMAAYIFTFSLFLHLLFVILGVARKCNYLPCIVYYKSINIQTSKHPYGKVSGLEIHWQVSQKKRKWLCLFCDIFNFDNDRRWVKKYPKYHVSKTRIPE